MKKLAKRVKSIRAGPSYYDYGLLRENEERLKPMNTPTGTFPVYVGEKRERFVVHRNHLSHPLFKILLDKARDEFGFGQRSGLVLPCSVGAFQEIMIAVENSNGFDFGDLVGEFL
ncbi:SAUR-like auxin-responsive protein family [Striga hermonthica]|uniref:SAUR-like auxin-responsive protein family n=1 Tax=Striga hermonthica TaxID=68872 RepID=A0A9N7NYW8_STRHE|nr:SAUR-like auxin-responsive protein family [Striga hermonthica]